MTRDEWISAIRECVLCPPCNDDPSGKLLDRIQREIAEAVREAREQDCRAVCPYCEGGLVPTQTTTGMIVNPHSVWWHDGDGRCMADPIRRLSDSSKEGRCDHQWVGTSTASLPPKVIETHCGICGIKKEPK